MYEVSLNTTKCNSNIKWCIDHATDRWQTVMEIYRVNSEETKIVYPDDAWIDYFSSTPNIDMDSSSLIQSVTFVFADRNDALLFKMSCV